jgi:hypothetical protein
LDERAVRRRVPGGSSLRTRTFIKWSGFALILWALHLLVRDFTFAFTHGSTEQDMGRTFLGLEGKQYALVWPAFFPLGLLGFSGAYVQASARLGRIGRAGFVVALIGLGTWFLAQVMQYWILDIDKYFYSPLIYGGWLLQIAALFVLAAGLLLAGIDVQRAKALPRGRSLILIMGILTVPTFLLVAYLVGHSDGGLVSQLLYGGLSVPWDLCWLWLGYVLISAPRPEARGMPAVSLR